MRGAGGVGEEDGRGDGSRGPLAPLPLQVIIPPTGSPLSSGVVERCGYTSLNSPSDQVTHQVGSYQTRKAISEQLLYMNIQWFWGGLAFEAPDVCITEL